MFWSRVDLATLLRMSSTVYMVCRFSRHPRQRGARVLQPPGPLPFVLFRGEFSRLPSRWGFELRSSREKTAAGRPARWPCFCSLACAASSVHAHVVPSLLSHPASPGPAGSTTTPFSLARPCFPPIKRQRCSGATVEGNRFQQGRAAAAAGVARRFRPSLN